MYAPRAGVKRRAGGRPPAPLLGARGRVGAYNGGGPPRHQKLVVEAETPDPAARPPRKLVPDSRPDLRGRTPPRPALRPRSRVPPPPPACGGRPAPRPALQTPPRAARSAGRGCQRGPYRRIVLGRKISDDEENL